MKNFKVALKREFFIYIAILILLTLVMHSDLLSNPSSRFEMMYEKGNYTHPFLYSFVIYSIFFVLKKILDFIIHLFEK